MKLYKIFFRYDNTAGASFRIEVMDNMNETLTSYIRVDKRVSKEKLLKTDTVYNRDHKYISWYTYCLEDNIDEAKNILMEKCYSEFLEIEKKFEMLKQVVHNRQSAIKTTYHEG